MSLFSFSQEELLSFFAVLVRFSVLIAVLPFVGDRMVPVPAKILFSLAVTIALFPALVARGEVKPGDALFWGATTGSLVGTIGLEALFGLVLGFTARLVFDAISFGANLIGYFMGFASATFYDPHQETQTQVVSELHLALAMLIFLALDGHHLMLQSVLGSYSVVGLGKAGFSAALGPKLISMTGDVIRFGLQLSAPMALSLFSVNILFGIIAKAMPQLNVLVLSFSISIFVGLFVLLIAMPEFQTVTGGILERMGDWLHSVQSIMAS